MTIRYKERKIETTVSILNDLTAKLGELIQELGKKDEKVLQLQEEIKDKEEYLNVLLRYNKKYSIKWIKKIESLTTFRSLGYRTRAQVAKATRYDIVLRIVDKYPATYIPLSHALGVVYRLSLKYNTVVESSLQIPFNLKCKRAPWISQPHDIT